MVPFNSGFAFDWTQNNPPMQRPAIRTRRVMRGRRLLRFCWNDMAWEFLTLGFFLLETRVEKPLVFKMTRYTLEKRAKGRQAKNA